MKLKSLLKKILSKINRILMKLGSLSSRLSNIYYFIFSNAFGREHQSVLSGKLKYLNDIKTLKSTAYQLVRNTHRIEKGLLMRPRRSIFALGYIEETIDCFGKQYKSNSAESSAQIKWSQDVLRLYFEVTEDNDLINQQKKRFEKILCNNKEKDGKKSVPYYNKKLITINYDEFYKLALQRRSTRWFKQKKIPRELIDKAILAAIQAPSACNRQPFEYRVIDDENLLKDVVHFPGGTAGYANNIPVMIIAIGNLNAYFSERDRHLIYIDASLANMSLMFALETLGLSSCAINWPDVEMREQKMEDFLDLEKYQRPVMCLAVGYADPKGMVAHSEKKDLSVIRKYN